MELICIISVMQCNKRLTVVELEIKIIDLKRWYMPIDLNPVHHNNKLKTMRKLFAILKQFNRQDFQQLSRINDIILCALTLIYYFGMRSLRLNKSTSNYFTRRCSKRQFLKAETVFQKTMCRLLPERSEATTTIMLTFFTGVNIWPFENFVVEILKIVLNFTRKETTVFHMLLGDAASLVDLSSVRHRIRVLYELLNCDHIIFEKWNIVLPFIHRLLDYYAREDDGSIKPLHHDQLRKGLEACLYRIFGRVHNQHRLSIVTTLLDWYSSLDIEGDDILKFSLLLQHTVAFYKVGSFSESLTKELLNPISIKLIDSTNPLLSLVGCRLILLLIDRHHNAPQVVEPKLYYEIKKTQLKVGPCENIDQLFIRHHREKIHTYFMTGLKLHCEHIANMKAMFSVLCCIILEVPCGVTAAAVACTMMVVQDYALNGEDISPRSRYWMHAVVISVMSLICWVHKAPVLRMYVNQIITRRANEAPHLNPPLLQEYNVKRLNPWTRKTLFFEDWEMRYGLWKAFEIPPGLKSTV